MLFNANSAIFQLYHGDNKLNFNDDDVSFVLDQLAELDFYSASSLKHLSTDRLVASLGHIILILANQYLLLILNAAYLAGEATKYQFYSRLFDPTGDRTHDLPHSRLAC